MKKKVWLVLAGAMLAATAVTAGAATDEEKCLGKRAKAKGIYERCVQNWLSKVYGGVFAYDAVDARERLAKCRTRYAANWPRLQQLTGTTCDQSRYLDNGDGTVTDNLTGLVWEMKTTAVGSGADLGGDRRDVDNQYTWSSGLPPYAENGTAHSDFLANLSASGFGGANGWRLATLAELLTILLPDPYPCATQPCIDSVFGSTQSAHYYWSATTYVGVPNAAYTVSFYDGLVFAGGKAFNFYVRAVRGGL